MMYYLELSPIESWKEIKEGDIILNYHTHIDDVNMIMDSDDSIRKQVLYYKTSQNINHKTPNAYSRIIKKEIVDYITDSKDIEEYDVFYVVTMMSDIIKIQSSCSTFKRNALKMYMNDPCCEVYRTMIKNNISPQPEVVLDSPIINTDRLQDLSTLNPKPLMSIGLKLHEEASEVTMALDAVLNPETTNNYKGFTTHDVLEECVDVFIVAYSLYVKMNGNGNGFQDLLDEKLDKWQDVMEDDYEV